MGSGWEEVNLKIDEALEEGVFPGGIIKVLSKGGTVFERSFGVTDYKTGRKVEKDVVYDLASLTKPLATTVSLIKLYGDGRINLTDKISDFMDIKDAKKGSITLFQLLNHTSGLPAHREYFLDLNKHPSDKRKEHLKKLLLEEPLENEPGEKFVYSDLGFMFLAWIIEIVTGENIKEFLHRIYSDLGIKDLFYTGLSPDGKNIYAPTENCNYRGLLKGVVHDDNCYSVSGICGHAGLFGRVEGVYQIVRELLNSYREDNHFFKREAVIKFFERQGGFRKPLGFDAPDDINSSCGKLFSFNTIGHLGFTGTSLWIDLERDIIVILLTNRVHPTRENTKIRIFRPVLHDAVMEALL